MTSHFARMWIGFGVAALLIVLLSSNLWLMPQHAPGVVPSLMALFSLPFVLAFAAYQRAAWRTQAATGASSSARSTRLPRLVLWLTGAAGLLWWGIAADWLLSLLVTFVLFVFLLIQTAAIAGRARYASRRIWPDITACICLTVLVLSAAVTAWPLRLLFLASRSQLDAMAARVEAGLPVEAPAWVGAFRIARTEIRTQGWGGGTCLWVFPNPGNPTGLLRSDKPGGPGANVNRKIRLSEHWYYVSED